MEKYLIPNLKNACILLKALAHGPKQRRLSDLARDTGIPPTSALRIARTLEQEGLLRRELGELRLGPALIYLGSAALKDTEIQHEAVPVLLALTKATDETSHVAVPCDQHALIVAVNDSPHPLGAASRPGTLADLHCSATGKVFLAFTRPEALEGLLPSLRLTRQTPNSLTSVALLEREISRIRQCGYSVDNEEVYPGVRCLAAPVADSSGNVIAAIGITASAARFLPEHEARVASHVLQAAGELSRRLGRL